MPPVCRFFTATGNDLCHAERDAQLIVEFVAKAAPFR